MTLKRMYRIRIWIRIRNTWLLVVFNTLVDTVLILPIGFTYFNLIHSSNNAFFQGISTSNTTWF